MTIVDKKGSAWILIGILMIIAALGWTAYNFWTAGAAGKRAESAAGQLAKTIPAEPAAPFFAPGDEVEYPDYVLNPDMDMPVKEIDGYSYIGLLEIPALGLEFPVQKDWNYPGLRVSPCRYEGSIYRNNMVICGHNYPAHFGSLKELAEGDTVYFTDTDGNRFSYQVKETEVLAPSASEEMVSGDWDLTLFTCTIGGLSRVTVRCSRSTE